MTAQPNPAGLPLERRRRVRCGDVVDQARELVVARHGGCSADQAMAMLIDLAERMERPVQEVAADLLASSRR